MDPMDQRITVWARSVPADARRNGPTLTDLGGEDEVLASAAYFTNGPFLDHLVLALAHQLEHEPGDETELHDLLLAGLAATTRHAAFAGAVDALTHRPALARALGVRLTKTLLRRLTDAQDAGDDPAAALIGAEAVDFLVQLALSQTISSARLLGIMDAHHPAAGLREALERCLPFDRLFRDAAFELALADIRTALQQRTTPRWPTGSATAGSALPTSPAVDPDRIDARIYRAGIDGQLGLSAPDGPQRVAAAADTLRENLQRYRSWRMRTTTPSWTCGRQDDITAWAQLTTLLDQAAHLRARRREDLLPGHPLHEALLRGAVRESGQTHAHSAVDNLAGLTCSAGTHTPRRPDVGLRRVTSCRVQRARRPERVPPHPPRARRPSRSPPHRVRRSRGRGERPGSTVRPDCRASPPVSWPGC